VASRHPQKRAKIHKGGFYHDGRFATLTDVVTHYNNHFQTSLTEQEKADI